MSNDPNENMPVRAIHIPSATYPAVSPHVIVPQHRPTRPPETLTPAFVWRTVRQWWKIALPLAILLAAGGGAIVWLTFKPTYRTTAWLLIKEQPDYLAFKSDANPRFVKTQVELLQGPVVMERVLAKPAVARLPEITEQASPMEWLQKNIAAKNQGNSDLYELTFAGPNPVNVTTIINAVIQSYLEFNLETTQLQTNSVVQKLTQEQELLRKTVEQLRETVRDLAKQVTGEDPFAPSANREILALRSPKAALQENLVTTQVDREIMEAELNSLEESLREAPRKLSEGLLMQLVEARPELAKFKEERLAKRQLQKEYERLVKPGALQKLQTAPLDNEDERESNLRTQLKEAIIQDVQNSELAKRQQLVEEMRQKVDNLKRREQLLQENVKKLTQQQVQTGDHAIELEFRKGELERAESVYQRIADRILALNTESQAPDRVLVMHKAIIPTEAEVKSPWKLLTLVCSALFLLPFLVAISWEHRVRRILEPNQIVDEAELPVVGEIAILPRQLIGTAGGRGLSWSRHVFEESVDSLRTALVLSDQLKHVQVIAVVSAVSREGKTSLSAQLSVSLARATGEPVLLIDADMRSPDLHKLFDVAFEPGLVKALSNETDVTEAIQYPAVNPLIHLLPAGRLHKSPHSLFGNGRLTSLIARLRDQYRYIVIDTPPILSASESLVAAKAADGTLICTLREASRTTQVRQTYQRLQSAGARVIGVVLSGVPTRTYAYKYGSYGYSKHIS